MRVRVEPETVSTDVTTTTEIEVEVLEVGSSELVSAELELVEVLVGRVVVVVGSSACSDVVGAAEEVVSAGALEVGLRMLSMESSHACERTYAALVVVSSGSTLLSTTGVELGCTGIGAADADICYFV